MNLEKTIDKNMFNISSAIRNANPLAPADRIKPEHREHHDQHDPMSATATVATSHSSMLSHPKQKLATQFKRAITMLKQRGEHLVNSPSVSSLPHASASVEKPFDSMILTSLTEESLQNQGSSDNFGKLSSSSTLTPKSQSYVQIKPQATSSSQNEILTRINNDTNNPPSATLLPMDSPILRTSQTNPSARIVKQSLQQIHSSIIQTMHPHHPLSPQTTSSSATLSATPTSSSTMGTGEVAILETIL